MTPRAANRWSLVFVLAPLVVAALLYSRLPDPVPTHWNVRGVADGFTPKPFGAFMGPLVMAGLWLLFAVLPRVSPRGYQLSQFEATWSLIRTAIVGFLGAIITGSLLAAAGWPVPMNKVVIVLLAALVVLLGNVLGKVRKNFFVGIRTPWTLASDEVWLRTHRMAGRLMVIAGLVTLVAGLAGAPASVALGAIGAALLVPTVWSYVLYRRLEGFR